LKCYRSREATGGSTNAVLHLLAIAHSAGVDLKISDFETVRREVPVLCDLKPSGKYVATDLHKVAAFLVMRYCLRMVLSRDCMTITGRRWRKISTDVSPIVPKIRLIRPLMDPFIRKATSRSFAKPGPPRWVAKISGIKTSQNDGPARVFGFGRKNACGRSWTARSNPAT